MDVAQFLREYQLSPLPNYNKASLARITQRSPAALRKAAVLIGLIQRESGLSVILTKRASHLRHHPGQIAFPGGKVEDDDASLYHTAVREAHEEIGLNPVHVTLIGQLAPLPTISGYQVTPILASVNPSATYVIDRNEVDEVFEVPLDTLLYKENLIQFNFLINAQPHPVFALPFQNHLIWGMTGQIIEAMSRKYCHLFPAQ
jgi:8-oxo-dGTP pyrophosphatase MutT (NUDIX family)